MIIADLHIHSRYSRATSQEGDLPHLDLWARRKGIHLVGTGDFTHPAWRRELEENLIPAQEGFYRLREDQRLPDDTAGNPIDPRFVVSGEISSIYKKNGRVRKVHNVILLPGLEEADLLAARLEAIGNIHSDGRPILGLDSRDLLEITLEVCPHAIFIPAHIWTPHFSLFGAFSGFDTIEECFEDLTPYIHALETGLSSDPPMNRAVSALDRFILVSHSDAHSPQKLGREADLFDIELSYPAMARALETGEGFAGTLEFFPEEGKYHLDGHRACHLCLEPAETVRLGGKCPVCGKKLTIGVQHRVEELADRPIGFCPPDAKPFESIVPLPEVIAAATGIAAAGKRTQEVYAHLLRTLGPEFTILRELPISRLEQEAGPCIAEGIRRLRAGLVERVPGYDGAYGTISLFAPHERELFSGQTSLFGTYPIPIRTRKTAPLSPKPAVSAPKATAPTSAVSTPNPEQETAITAAAPTIAVIAGPGTGKTHTLVSRIVHLIETGIARPQEITAVTFTRQAAEEMRQRLEERLGGRKAVRGLTIGTFHSLCWERLGRPPLVTETEALEIAGALLREHEQSGSARTFLQQLSRWKAGLSSQPAVAPSADSPAGEACIPDSSAPPLAEEYAARLAEKGVLDFDDLLLRALETAKRPVPHLLVDEFQDVSPIQLQLVLRWSQGGRSLFVIGDPDQSIYGFRGAAADCFDRLRQARPELETIRLLRNYRSAPEILSCSLPVISQNPGQSRTLQPSRPAQEPVRLVQADTPFAQGVFIAKEIGRLTGGMDMLEAQALGGDGTRSFSEIAVLCRTHRQLDQIEACLRHDSIPCIISGREDYLTDPSVRGCLAFFRWLSDPQDRLSLELALRLVWDLPADVTAACLDFRRDHSAAEVTRLLPDQEERPLLLPVLAAIDKYQLRLPKDKPHKLIEHWMADRGDTKPLARLKQTAVFFPDTAAFLDTLASGQEADIRRASGKAKTPASGAVRLMTLHGSKGLEFPVVFLAGLTQGQLPLESPRHPTDPEEERRLLFVGMTRARDSLILTGSEPLSPFLNALPGDPAYLQRETATDFRPAAEQLHFF